MATTADYIDIEDLAHTDEEERLLARIEWMERLLDRQYALGGFRFGLDPVLGLFPVAGDTVAAAMSGWLIWQAHKAGAPGHVKARMVGHTALDYVLGLIPIVGWVGDFFYRSNTKNVKLLKAHLLDSRARRARPVN